MENIPGIVNASKASIDKGDLVEILKRGVEINAKVILEIGTWKGYSAKAWYDAFHPDLLITMDKSPMFPDSLLPKLYNYHIWYDTDSHSADTQLKVINTLGTRQVDFLFIDGDHSYAGVKQDFEMYSPFVRPGGMVVFHDALYHAPVTEEVDIFWREIKDKYTHITYKQSPASTGVGIIYL